jgi:uncharacterized membrane protein
MRKQNHVVWTVLLAAFLAAGLALLILFNSGFDLARSTVDLLARDGSADPFTPELYRQTQLPLTALGIVLLALVGVMVTWRQRSQTIVGSGVSALQQFLDRFLFDIRGFLRDLCSLAFTRQETMVLAGLIILALIARLGFIMQPFKHDEAYTVAVFANQTLGNALSDYHLPNNHLFHTLLVHLTYSIFGYAQWAVRLPSFIAGIMTIPALYLLARMLHGRTAALIAAAAAAAMPVMIEFATQARGYTLVMLFSLLLFILGIYIRRRANRFAWALVVILTVLGIYTIPVFYFPYLSFLVWIGLAFLIGDIDFKAYGSRWHFIGWTVLSGIFTLLLTVLVYLPPVFRSGLDKVLPYQVSDPLTYALFLQEVNVRLTEFLQIVLVDLPPFLWWIIAVGILLSTLFPLRSETTSPAMQVCIPLQFAVLLGTFGLVFVLRAPPWARFITFLVPLGLMWAAAGWVGLLRRVQTLLKLRWKLEYALVVLVLVGITAGTLIRFTTHRNAGFQVLGREERLALHLKSVVVPGDLIVVTDPQDAAIWYYWLLHGMDMSYYRSGDAINRVFVILDPTEGQTLAAALAYRGPPSASFDLDQTEIIFQSGHLRVYQLLPLP